MKIGYRQILGVFLLAAFLAAQWAAQLHGNSHLRHELSIAAADAHHGHPHADGHDKRHQADPDGHDVTLANGQEDGAPEPLDHQAERCLVFHALDCKTTAPAISTLFAAVSAPEPVVYELAASHQPEFLSFHSRAPPARRS